MLSDKSFQICEVVSSLSGRDKGTNYIIINEDKDFIYLVNGKTKFLEKPKKKKKKHVLSKNIIITTLQAKIINNQKIYNEEIFSAFRKNNIDFFEKEIVCLKKM